MSKKCIIKKYLSKMDPEFSSFTEVKNSDLRMICDLALIALDKDTPVKVTDPHVCPSCNSDLMACNYGDDCCRSCGKRLKW